MASTARAQLSQSIRAVWTKVHSTEGLPFPKTVAALLALGVARYHIHYIASTATAYISNADTGTVNVDIAPIPSHFPPGFNFSRTRWSEEAMVKAIRRAQAGEVNYHEFSRECVEAGAIFYIACLEGKKVAYKSALGDFHVEWFPGAGPKK